MPRDDITLLGRVRTSLRVRAAITAGEGQADAILGRLGRLEGAPPRPNPAGIVFTSCDDAYFRPYALHFARSVLRFSPDAGLPPPPRRPGRRDAGARRGAEDPGRDGGPVQLLPRAHGHGRRSRPRRRGALHHLHPLRPRLAAPARHRLAGRRARRRLPGPPPAHGAGRALRGRGRRPVPAPAAGASRGGASWAPRWSRCRPGRGAGSCGTARWRWRTPPTAARSSRPTSSCCTSCSTGTCGTAGVPGGAAGARALGLALRRGQPGLARRGRPRSRSAPRSSASPPASRSRRCSAPPRATRQPHRAGRRPPPPSRRPATPPSPRPRLDETGRSSPERAAR